MLSIQSEVKFLTARDDINIKDTDFGVFKYIEKKYTAGKPYLDSKIEYAIQQQYTLSGKKSKQAKKSIKKLEELLKHNKIVHCAWSDNVMLQMLLSNGLLIHICINTFTGDIIRMAFDRFFVGKLISESVIDVVITRLNILISYNVNQITFVHLQKPNLKKNAPEKISKMDPKIFNIIISGSHARRIPRHLACNNSNDILAIWTKSSQNEVYPWRPTVRDQDRANIHIYRINRQNLDLLCYYWTENDPINVEFSKMSQNQLRSIEQKISRKGEVTIEICVYDINNSKIQRTSVTSIPLQSQVCCHSFSPDNEKLMLGCIDTNIIFFDEGRGITHLIKAAFIPTMVSWHADCALVIIANDKGQLQCYDISLSCIRNQVINEDMASNSVLDLTGYFTTQPKLLQICCNKKPDLTLYKEQFIQNDSYVLLLFENGPLAIIRLFGGSGHKGDMHTSGFTADVLIQQYLKLNNVERAINLLLCMNWDVYGAMLMLSLHKIASYIFKQPFQPEREAQLQKALGSFLVPVKPLCEETQIEFGNQVKDITRKFFQYLLRYESYEMAFNLAIDIDDEDLFMDLTNCTKENALFELSKASFCKAEEIVNRSESTQSSHSTCSRESCSFCNTNSSADDESENHHQSYVDFEKNITSSKQSIATRLHKPINAGLSRVSCNEFSNIQINIPKSKKVAKNVVIPKNRAENNAEILNFSFMNKLTLTEVSKSLKYQKSFSQAPLAVCDQSQYKHHLVVNVIPTPQLSPHEWNVPDQTIGIPIIKHKNSKPTLPSEQCWSKQQIIHHPLVSGYIPSSSSSYLHENHMASPTPYYSSQHSQNVYSSILIPSTTSIQPSSKKENGEKHKVKFSNTVTVAVVPDFQGKDNAQINHDIRNVPNIFPFIQSNDSFSHRQQTGSSKSTKSSKETNLTWV